MVVDFALPDMSGFDLRKLSESIIIKNARSPERLLAETSLHRASAKLPPEKRKMLEEEQKVDPALNGKKVLVIDDDEKCMEAGCDRLRIQAGGRRSPAVVVESPSGER